MSIDMYLSASQTQATCVSTMTKQQMEGYEDLQKAMNEFTLNSPFLTGKAYDSAKVYFSTVLYPLVQGGILLSKAVEQAVKKFPEEYIVQVDSGNLKQSELEEKISQVTNLIDQATEINKQLTALNSSTKGLELQLSSNALMLNLYGTMKRMLEEKLRKLLEFNASSPAIFTEIKELEQALIQGLAQTKTAFNASDGMFMIPPFSTLNWRDTIVEKLQKKKDDEQQRIKEKISKESLPTTKAEILNNYHWSTSTNMYVNNKTGLPSSEVTSLYNKLVQEEHAPQKNPQLEFFNEMLRTGKHPVTGKTVTNAERLNAKVMIYSLALQPFVGALAISKVPQGYEKSSSASNLRSDSSPNKETSTVGRWMSDNEYTKMTETGKVQMSPNGNRTYVAVPPSKDAFPSAPKGSLYTEFDVNSNSIYPAGNDNWAQIPGPGSLIDRLNQKKGLPPITEMPDAVNIKKIGDK